MQKASITWENEDIYLNSLYKFLILSLTLIILYHYDKTKNNSKLLEDPENINLTKEFNNHIKEKNNEEHQSLIH